MSRVDNITKWVGDRIGVARDVFTKRAPRYIAWESDSNKFDLDEYLFNQFSHEDLRGFSKSIPWIYSNLLKICNEAMSARLMVVEEGTDEEKKGHEFTHLFQRPNPFFGPSLTLEYAVQAMLSDRWGGFWYLSPNEYDYDEIMEIWPVPANRMRPIQNKEYVTHYAYFPGGAPEGNSFYAHETDYLIIPASHVCRFFFADPDNLWRNLTPLEALRRGINVYENIASSQESLFGAGGGVPLSIVLLDRFMSEPDFISARTQIMEDWQSKKRIAVARGGGLEVKNVGISNKELEVVESLKLNRDEIDAVYMTFSWRNEGFTSGEARRQVDREIKSAVIYPLLKRMGEQITTQIIYPYYDQACVARFSDVRKQDKALEIQGHAVDWRARTFNEARRDLNDGPYQLPQWFVERLGLDPEAADIGELPFQWVISPSTMSAFLGIGQQEEIGMEEELTPQGGEERPPGNIEDQIDPEAETNLEANNRQRGDRTDVNLDISETMKALTPIQQEGIKAELKRYRKVLVRRMEQGQTPAEIEFDTEVVPAWMMDRLREQMAEFDSTETDRVKSLLGELIK